MIGVYTDKIEKLKKAIKAAEAILDTDNKTLQTDIRLETDIHVMKVSSPNQANGNPRSFILARNINARTDTRTTSVPLLVPSQPRSARSGNSRVRGR